MEIIIIISALALAAAFLAGKAHESVNALKRMEREKFKHWQDISDSSENPD